MEGGGTGAAAEPAQNIVAENGDAEEDTCKPDDEHLSRGLQDALGKRDTIAEQADPSREQPAKQVRKPRTKVNK